MRLTSPPPYLVGRVQRSATAALVTLGLLGCGSGTIMNTRQEVALGRQMQSEIERQYRVEESGPDTDRVRRIGERLLGHTDERPGVPYTFTVLDTKEINAVSLPGGPVYVFRGLLDLVGDDDDALACIIGHEVGHVNARHVSRMITQQTEINVVLTVLLSGRSIGAQNVAGLAADLFALKFSRDDEYEADRRGLSYAYRSGFDPNGLVRFFDKLEILEKKTGTPPEFFSTHPVTAARVSKAKSIIAAKAYTYGQ